MPKLRPEIQKIKDKAFAQAYLDNGFNGTKAAMEVFTPKDAKSAGVIGSQRLGSISVREALLEVMAEKRLDLKHIVDKWKRNVNQSDNYAASNTGIDMFLRVLGAYATEKKSVATFNFDIKDQDISKTLNTLGSQIQELKDTFSQ